MPRVYLSPSLQEFNPYLTEHNEEYYMNLIADAMVPYLEASGIEVVRNRPDQTLSEVIRESNNSNIDLHLALHSNASPESLRGQLRGPQVYFYPTSYFGRAAADIIDTNLKDIYPIPSLVQTIPITTLQELKKTAAPSVLVEIAYHDNPEDERWIKDNIDIIGRNLAKSVTEYFGIPFVEPK